MGTNAARPIFRQSQWYRLVSTPYLSLVCLFLLVEDHPHRLSLIRLSYWCSYSKGGQYLRQGAAVFCPASFQVYLGPVSKSILGSTNLLQYPLLDSMQNVCGNCHPCECRASRRSSFKPSLLLPSCVRHRTPSVTFWI